MKNTILGILGVFIIIYTIVIGMEVYNTQIRKNQLDNAVSKIVKDVLEVHYKGSDTQAKQDLEKRIKESLHKNAEIEIEVLSLDMEKGVLSVTVRENYQQMNGRFRTESVNKTAIIERNAESSR